MRGEPEYGGSRGAAATAVIHGTGALLLAAGLALSGPAAAASHPKKAVYGAIAINRDSKAVGYAYDFKTSKDAKRAALSQCGEQKCEVIVTFRNGCAAAARGKSHIVTMTGATRDEAETKVQRKCGKDCEILAWACTKE